MPVNRGRSGASARRTLSLTDLSLDLVGIFSNERPGVDRTHDPNRPAGPSLVPTVPVGMPSGTLRVRISCRRRPFRRGKTTQSVADGIPTQSVGTSERRAERWRATPPDTEYRRPGLGWPRIPGLLSEHLSRVLRLCL